MDPERPYEHKEDVLARGGAVGASAGRGGREGNGVYIPSSAEDEEVGVGAVEEEESMVDGADDAVRDGVGRGTWATVKMGVGAGGRGFHLLPTADSSKLGCYRGGRVGLFLLIMQL